MSANHQAYRNWWDLLHHFSTFGVFWNLHPLGPRVVSNIPFMDKFQAFISLVELKILSVLCWTLTSRLDSSNPRGIRESAYLVSYDIFSSIPNVLLSKEKSPIRYGSESPDNQGLPFAIAACGTPNSLIAFK